MGTSPGDFGKSKAHLQCTAKSKRSGERCKGPAIYGSRTQKCRMHGGGASIGIADPSFKHGRYSRYLPADMTRLYAEALSNPELLEMLDHIALLEARIQHILADNAAGDPVPNWQEVKDLFNSLEAVVSTGDKELITGAFENARKAIAAGISWDRTWGQVSDTMEQLRKMTDTEVKRKKELNQMVPIERIMILMSAVGMAVKRNVTNADEVQKVHAELALLIGSNATPGDRGLKVMRVGPEVIDVSPETRGVKGGRSTRAANLRKKKEREAVDPPLPPVTTTAPNPNP
jgi:hypothetical protein